MPTYGSTSTNFVTIKFTDLTYIDPNTQAITNTYTNEEWTIYFDENYNKTGLVVSDTFEWPTGYGTPGNMSNQNFTNLVDLPGFEWNGTNGTNFILSSTTVIPYMMKGETLSGTLAGDVPNYTENIGSWTIEVVDVTKTRNRQLRFGNSFTFGTDLANNNAALTWHPVLLFDGDHTDTWGNGEAQRYVDYDPNNNNDNTSNIQLTDTNGDGNDDLIIRASNELGVNNSITDILSGRVVMKETTSTLTPEHGKKITVSITAQLSEASDLNKLWPALWLMGTQIWEYDENDNIVQGWPRNGEIDLMEWGTGKLPTVNNDISTSTSKFVSALHWGDDYQTDHNVVDHIHAAGSAGLDPSYNITTPHTYTLKLLCQRSDPNDPNSNLVADAVIEVDGFKIKTFEDINPKMLNRTDNSPNTLGLIMNLAVGGNFAGETVTPTTEINTSEFTITNVTINKEDYTQPLNLTLTTSGSAVRLTGPWWGWDPNGGPEAVNNGDGSWTVTFDLPPTADMEYLWVVDGVQENLIDNAANGECASEIDSGSMITDYAGWANRVWVLGSGDRTDTYDACAGTGSGGGSGDGSGSGDSNGIVFSGQFGGAVVDGNTYTFPTGSEPWGGFANEDTSLYPFTFANDSSITFTANTNGNDATIYFRFEKNPYPDTEPSLNTDSITISGANPSEYTVNIPAQGGNTFSSFLLYVTTHDVPVTITNVAVNVGSSAPASLNLTLTTDATTSVRLTGPWWGWDPNGGPVAVNNGDGTWTVTLDPVPTENMEYLWVVDGVQENLIDNAANGDCTSDIESGSLITDYAGYANRVWVLGSGDRTDTYDACAGSVVVSGCMDSQANNYNSSATQDDGSCLYQVTFNVDMSCPDPEIDPTTISTVHITGPDFGWTQDITLTNNGDNTYSITLDLPAGGFEYKYMLNYWGHQENLVDDMQNGATCAPVTDYNSFANRQITVSNGLVVNDTYGRCGECPGVVEPTAYTAIALTPYFGYKRLAKSYDENNNLTGVSKINIIHNGVVVDTLDIDSTFFYEPSGYGKDLESYYGTQTVHGYFSNTLGRALYFGDITNEQGVNPFGNMGDIVDIDLQWELPRHEPLPAIGLKTDGNVTTIENTTTTIRVKLENSPTYEPELQTSIDYDSTTNKIEVTMTNKTNSDKPIDHIILDFRPLYYNKTTNVISATESGFSLNVTQLITSINDGVTTYPLLTPLIVNEVEGDPNTPDDNYNVDLINKYDLTGFTLGANGSENETKSLTIELHDQVKDMVLMLGMVLPFPFENVNEIFSKDNNLNNYVLDSGPNNSWINATGDQVKYNYKKILTGTNTDLSNTINLYGRLDSRAMDTDWSDFDTLGNDKVTFTRDASDKDMYISERFSMKTYNPLKEGGFASNDYIRVVIGDFEKKLDEDNYRSELNSFGLSGYPLYGTSSSQPVGPYAEISNISLVPGNTKYLSLRNSAHTNAELYYNNNNTYVNQNYNSGYNGFDMIIGENNKFKEYSVVVRTNESVRITDDLTTVERDESVNSSMSITLRAYACISPQESVTKGEPLNVVDTSNYDADAIIHEESFCIYPEIPDDIETVHDKLKDLLFESKVNRPDNTTIEQNLKKMIATRFKSRKQHNDEGKDTTEEVIVVEASEEEENNVEVVSNVTVTDDNTMTDTNTNIINSGKITYVDTEEVKQGEIFIFRTNIVTGSEHFLHVEKITETSYIIKIVDNNNTVVDEDDLMKHNNADVVGNEITVDEDDIVEVTLNDKEYTILIGSLTFQETGSGSAVGDPHIAPIYGKICELPAKVTNYRMVEGENLTINTKTRYFTSEEKESIKEYYVEQTGDAEGAKHLITNGVVQNEVFVQNGSTMFTYNFDTKQLSSNESVSYKVKQGNKQTTVMFKVKNDTHGIVRINCTHYENPQLYSGISTSIQRNAKECVGLLVNNYEPSAFEVNTITNTESKQDIAEEAQVYIAPTSTLVKLN
jgi:hypothetical protein